MNGPFGVDVVVSSRSRAPTKRPRIKKELEPSGDFGAHRKHNRNTKLVMKGSTNNRRSKVKAKENPVFHPFERAERKSSMCDSNDSAINSPRSMGSAGTPNSISEVDEQAVFEIDLEFPMDTELGTNALPTSFFTQVISENNLFTLPSHSLPQTKPFCKGQVYSKSYQPSHKPENTYRRVSHHSISSDFPSPAPYRGGRKKEPPPPMMTEEEEKQYQKERMKKDNHNAIEKRRRYKINDCITEMGRLLPPTYDIDVLNKKGTILQTSIEYIKKLQTDQINYHDLIMKFGMLENSHKQLKTELESLKSQLRSGSSDQLIVTTAGNAIQVIQQENHNFFDLSLGQPVKQEISMLRENATLLQGNQVTFSSSSVGHQPEFLKDEFMMLKSESQDSGIRQSPQFDRGSEGSSSYSDFYGVDTTLREDYSHSFPDPSCKSFSDLMGSSVPFLTGPDCDILSQTGMPSSDGISFYSSVFLDHLDVSSFHDISDPPLEMDGSLYTISNDFGTGDDELTRLN